MLFRSNFYDRLSVKEVVGFDEATRTLTFKGEARRITGVENSKTYTYAEATEFTFKVVVPTGVEYATTIKAGTSLRFSGLQMEQGTVTIVDYSSIK